MILIRLRAQDLRTIESCNSPEQAMGVLELIRVRVAEAQTLKEFKKSPIITENRFGWKEAATVLHGILGDALRYPPHPDRQWYSRLQRTIDGHGLDAEYVTKLGEHAKAHLKPSYSLDFLITQHLRILAGDFDNQAANRYGSTVMNSGRMGGKTGASRQTDSYIEEKLC